MKEIVIYYLKDNYEIMLKFADLRKDIESDLSLKCKYGMKKYHENIGIIYLKASKDNLQHFIDRNKHLLKKYNDSIVIA